MLSRLGLLVGLVLLSVGSALAQNVLPDDWMAHWQSCDHEGYSYSVLTLTWPGYFCGKKHNKKYSCVKEWRDQWDGYLPFYLVKALPFTGIGPHTKEAMLIQEASPILAVIIPFHSTNKL